MNVQNTIILFFLYLMFHILCYLTLCWVIFRWKCSLVVCKTSFHIKKEIQKNSEKRIQNHPYNHVPFLFNYKKGKQNIIFLKIFQYHPFPPSSESISLGILCFEFFFMFLWFVMFCILYFFLSIELLKFIFILAMRQGKKNVAKIYWIKFWIISKCYLLPTLIWLN